MDEFGITPDALADSIQHDLDHPPLYRDARGNEWNGLGAMPDWLGAAKNAGVNPDFFRIEERAEGALDRTRTSKEKQQRDLFL